MKIGCPKEIKVHEYRVGLVPAGVRELVAAGHEVMVEANAGAGIGIVDDAYRAAGATVVPDAKTVFASSDLVVKVKEPQLPECAQLRRGQVLFTYLHLAADKEQAKALAKSGVTAYLGGTIFIQYSRAGRIGSGPSVITSSVDSSAALASLIVE